MKRVILVLVWAMIGVTGSGQQQIRNLVMEGGGIRGIAYIGALQVLDSNGILANLERVGGTSAGSIQATLLAVGYTPDEMHYHLMETSFGKLNDGALFGLPGFIRLTREKGWYKGTALRTWIAGLIANKTGNGEMTFRQLNAQKQSFGNKDLYITATDLTHQRLLVFSHETFPDMKIADAVRISASIPFYYKPVWINAQGNTFDSPENITGLSMVVDGGLIANYPIKIFDSTRYIASYTSENKPIRNLETIGLELVDPDLMNVESRYINPNIAIRSNNDYVKAIYHLMLDKTAYDLDRTISISNCDISSRVRSLKEHTVYDLVVSGRTSAEKFIEEMHKAVVNSSTGK